MTSKSWRRVSHPVAAALLAGCSAFGPPRDPPRIAVAEHYAAISVPADLPAAEGTAQHLAVGGRPIPRWWESYQSAALDALVEEGLARSPSLAAAKSTLTAAREQLRSQIGQNLVPNVDLAAEPVRERALGIPVIPQETFLENVFVAEVQASYTFDFFGAAILADRALARQVQEQAYQLESTRRALAANIVLATIDSASLHEQLAATERVVALGEERARQVAARYRAGSASRDEMLASEEDAANASATLPALRAQALAVRHAQAVLLGRSPEEAPEPLPLDAFEVPRSIPLTVSSDLLRQRPDILAAEAQVRATADEAGAATASMFPSLTLSASYGRGGFDWSTFSSPAGAIWSVGATITQPLFHGGALAARRRQYQASYEAAVAQYRETVLSAFRNVADTLVSLDADAQTLAQARRAADAADAAAQDAEARYRLGSAQFYTTLGARQQFHNARIQYLRARAARLADSASLFDSMGNPPVGGPDELLPHATKMILRTE
jgi:NodT family efflux transporter outer membrane factor (OMF) lipoprotein